MPEPRRKRRLPPLHGADPNNSDNAGDVPIFECVFYNTHGMLDLLLQCPDTKLDNVNNVGQKMLHFVGLYADLRRMEMLTSERICGLRRDARDKQGRTARMAFERTFTPNEQFCRAFDGEVVDAIGEASMVQIGDGGLRRVLTENGNVHVGDDDEMEVNLWMLLKP